jgi:gluconokinase
MIVLVMGVSGVGKTTIGIALARELGWRYLDADDFHPPENVAKMAAGTPLEDADRWPWLRRINHELLALDVQNESVVLSCSALKERYREILRDGLKRFEIVYLHGEFELIRVRAESREHRFMPASLLKSQFAALQPPRDAIAVDVATPPEASVAAIVAKLEAIRP